MRRILTGVMAAIIALSLAPTTISKKVAANDSAGFFKVWETKIEENAAIAPVIAQDGSVYGIPNSLMGASESRLMKIKDGNVIWKSQEEISSLPFNIWPVILCDDKVIVAGESSGSDKLAESFMMLMCFSSDGQKLWEKSYTLTDSIPSYQVYDGNIWLIFENYVRIIDPTTGDETRKIDLGEFKKPTMNSNSSQGEDEETIDINFIYFVKNTMILNQMTRITSFEIGDQYDLKVKWQKTFDNSFSTLFFNLLAGLQINEKIFIASESEATMNCFDTMTGQSKWPNSRETGMFSFVFYNETNALTTDFMSTTCYDAESGDLVWKKEEMMFPLKIDREYFFVGGSILEGTSEVGIVDLKTGDKISQIQEKDVLNVVTLGNDLYLTNKTQLIKYSKCDPCVCEVEATWKDTGNDNLEMEICPLESKSSEITIANKATEGFVDCSFDASPANFTFSETSVRLQAGETKTVTVTYSADISEQVSSSHLVKVFASCNKTITLKLDVKKGDSCKEKLVKKFELAGNEYHLIGKTLVMFEGKRTGLFGYEFKSIKGLNLEDKGKTWTLDAKLFDGTEKLIFFRNEGNNLIAYGMTENDVLWFCIDAKTGKMLWKRTGGSPYIPGMPIFVDCYDEGETKEYDLFDITNGKNVITGLKLECDLELDIYGQAGDKYLFRTEDDMIICCDSKGKVYWEKELDICSNWTTRKSSSLYISEPIGDDGDGQEDKDDERSDDDFAPTKLSKVDSSTLKPIWTAEIVGDPSIINESKDRVWIHTKAGLYCFESSKGKLVWSLKDDIHGWNEPVVVDGKMCVSRYTRDDAEIVGETPKFLVINATDGKVVIEKGMKNYCSFVRDGKLLYARDHYYDENGELTDVHCFNVSDWKLNWTATGRGQPREIGTKMIFETEDGLYSWFENGKQIGEIVVEKTQDMTAILMGQSIVQWDKGYIFIDNGTSLFTIDAKSSRISWKLAKKDILSQAVISVGNNDGLLPKMIFTPCFMEGYLMLYQNEKLVGYEVIE